MTPEERALELWSAIPNAKLEAIPVFTAAIKAAENDALERAIAKCREIEQEAWGIPEEQAAAVECAEAIRSLKHNEDKP